MKTELITNVSHDIKTPLTSIIGYSDMLRSQVLPPERQLGEQMHVSRAVVNSGIAEEVESCFKESATAPSFAKTWAVRSVKQRMPINFFIAYTKMLFFVKFCRLL